MVGEEIESRPWEHQKLRTEEKRKPCVLFLNGHKPCVAAGWLSVRPGWAGWWHVRPERQVDMML